MLKHMVGREGLEPPESLDTRFTVSPATSYSLPTHTNGTDRGTRTLKHFFLPLDFKSSVYTYSTISAYIFMVAGMGFEPMYYSL